MLFTGAFTGAYASYAIGVHAVTGDAPKFRARERTWASVLARGWGMQVERFGGDDLDPGSPYIFMANHQSQVDIVALFVALPVVPGFLAKKELRKVPVLGKAMQVGGHVFIDRGKRSDAIAAVQSAAKSVREGASVVVFPEGTRNDRASIKTFKKGPFHLAQAAGVAIVPVGIRGSRAILPKHSNDLHAGGVQVHIGAPITPAEIASLELDALLARVRGDIGRLADLPLEQTAAESNA